MSNHLSIAVVGAGSAGMFTALILQKKGFRVTLFERAEQPRTEGCGILLVSDGVKTLDHSGEPDLTTKMVQAGSIARQFHFRNLKGKTLNITDSELDDDKPPSLLIRRSAIMKTIWGALDQRCFKGGHTVSEVQQTIDQVHIEFSNGIHWSGDMLIGADGIFSQVARHIVPERKLNYLGDRVWRGVVEDKHGFCKDGDFFVYARAQGIYANFFHLGPSDQGKPMTHWGFFHEEPIPKNRSEQQAKLKEPIPEEALKRLSPDAASLISSTNHDQIVTNWSFDIDPLPTLVKGRIALVGDAAHAMSSSQARGMTAGLEDAVELSNSIQNHTEIQNGLAHYNANRLPTVHKYQKRSREVSRKTGRKQTGAN